MAWTLSEFVAHTKMSIRGLPTKLELVTIQDYAFGSPLSGFNSSAVSRREKLRLAQTYACFFVRYLRVLMGIEDAKKKDGFFHGDPHPGNIHWLYSPTSDRGTLTLLDFGDAKQVKQRLIPITIMYALSIALNNVSLMSNASNWFLFSFMMQTMASAMLGPVAGRASSVLGSFFSNVNISALLTSSMRARFQGVKDTVYSTMQSVLPREFQENHVERMALSIMEETSNGERCKVDPLGIRRSQFFIEFEHLMVRHEGDPVVEKMFDIPGMERLMAPFEKPSCKAMSQDIVAILQALLKLFNSFETCMSAFPAQSVEKITEWSNTFGTWATEAVRSDASVQVLGKRNYKDLQTTDADLRDFMLFFYRETGFVDIVKHIVKLAFSAPQDCYVNWVYINVPFTSKPIRVSDYFAGLVEVVGYDAAMEFAYDKPESLIDQLKNLRANDFGPWYNLNLYYWRQLWLNETGKYLEDGAEEYAKLTSKIMPWGTSASVPASGTLMDPFVQRHN